MSLNLPLKYHEVTENIYSRKFYAFKNSDSFTTIVLKTFMTESAVYVFICVFVCNIHI